MHGGQAHAEDGGVDSAAEDIEARGPRSPGGSLLSGPERVAGTRPSNRFNPISRLNDSIPTHHRRASTQNRTPPVRVAVSSNTTGPPTNQPAESGPDDGAEARLRNCAQDPSKSDEHSSVVGWVGLDTAVQLLQVWLVQPGEDTPLESPRSLAGDDLQHLDPVMCRAEDRRSQSIVDVAIAPKYRVEIHRQGVWHAALPMLVECNSR